MVAGQNVSAGGDTAVKDVILGEIEEPNFNEYSSDINGDGKINISDVVCLLNHVNGSVPIANTSGLDMNGDKKINISDVVCLLNHVNGSQPLN